MKWIQASERMPDDNGQFHVKVKYNDGTISGAYLEYFACMWMDEDGEVIEWLDESPSLSLSAEQEAEELHKQAAELRSLKQSILESSLKKFFPRKEMSFHDKVVFAIDSVCNPPAILPEQEAREYAGKRANISGKYYAHTGEEVYGMLAAAYLAGKASKGDGWISVKDESKPPIGDKIMIYMAKRSDLNNAQSEYFAGWNGQYFYMWDDRKEKNVEDNPDYWFVTHWRLLPNEPLPTSPVK